MKSISITLVLQAVFGAVVLVVCGCTTTPGPLTTPPPAPTDFPAATGVVRRAVVAGLTAVDPAKYGGWLGDCPGCDVDAGTMALLCREEGLQVSELHNQECTAANLMATSRRAWSGMKPGDLFVFFISGHGGQIKDTNGDEADGQDETLCLWDGELSDDILAGLWQEIPAGVRVLFITDTCNSGTNFRYRPRSLKRTLPRAYTGSLIHFGGCADGKSSFGTESGGTFTTALIDGWSARNSYIAWFESAAAKMPRTQVPQYVEYGNVNASFRNSPALK